MGAKNARETRENEILSTVYLTYRQCAFSISALLLHDLFQKYSLFFFSYCSQNIPLWKSLKVMALYYVHFFHFSFTHVHSCLTAFNF